MRVKRSKFLTFIFSLLPGAGHMYMGFMKIGISLMSVFTTIIFIASWLSISPLLFILPILWFYSFFDCMNRRYASDEEFFSMEDCYLFSIDRLLFSGNRLFEKRRLLAGIILLLFGVYLIWNNLMNVLFRYIPQEVYTTMRHATNLAPQFVMGVVIIIIGVRLVIGRKKESDFNA